MKKILLFAFMLFFTCTAFSATYYFSSVSGDDSRTSTQARNSATPWKSLSKFNSYSISLQPGDSVLFKRGETFSGSINVSKSGTASMPIVVGAYGTGTRPVFTSLAEVSNFVSIGTNKYTSSVFTSTSDPKFLLLDGVLQQIGRWPNADAADRGYLFVDSISSVRDGYTNIIYNNWTGLSKPLTDWTGGQVAIRSNRFVFNTFDIAKDSQTYSGASTTFHLPYVQGTLEKTGFFLQNRIEALDQNGEWSFDGTANKASIFLSSSPGIHSIQMPSLDNGINITSGNNIIVDNINLTGYNKYGIYVKQSTNITFQNCTINLIGVNGFRNDSANINIKLLNSKINQSLGYGLIVRRGHQTCLRDTFTNIMPILGMNGTQAGDAVNTLGDSIIVQYCRFNNICYNGVQFNNGSHINISYNFFDSIDQRLDDGGAIYTVNQVVRFSYVDRLVKQNIVLNTNNGRRPVEGLPKYIDTARNKQYSAAIYGDLYTTDLTYDGNIIVGSERDGFFCNDPINVNWYNNVVYNAKGSSFHFANAHDDTNYKISGLNVKNNTVVNSSLAGPTDLRAVFLGNKIGVVSQYGNFDSNYYAYPLNKNALFRADTTNPTYYYLNTSPSWQSTFGFDLHSKLTPLYLSTTSIPKTPTKLVYNDTEGEQTYSLDGESWISAQGVKYNTSVTLKPFTALALIKDTNNIHLTPIADAYVRDGSYDTTNYGLDTILAIKASTILGRTRLSYLKFPLDSVKEVGSAKLRVYASTVINPGSPMMSIFGVDNDTWTESGIRYNNAPPSSTSALTSISVVDSERYYEFDVTNYVKTQAAGDKKVSFLLKDITNQENYVVFNSRENSQNKPELIIVAPVLIKPSDDAYVRDGNYQGLNYGTDTLLAVKKAIAGYSRKTYLKFPLNNIGNVKSAKLRLYGSNEDATDVKLSAYGVNTDSWSETSITWSNAPGSLTALLDTARVNNVAKYYEFDVTNFVKNEFTGDKTVSFVVKDTAGLNKLVTFNSSENAKFPPQLVVDYSGDATAISMKSIHVNGTAITKSDTEQNILGNNISFLKARLYPNPVNNKIHVAFPHTYKGNFNLQVMDILGRTYDLGKYNINKDGYEIDVNISKLSLKSGQYFIRILSDTQSTQTIKLIVQ